MKTGTLPYRLVQKEKIEMITHDVKNLFQKYDEIGFLYPAKKKLIAPYFEQIQDAWQKLCHSKEMLLWILALKDVKKEQNFASISVWKHNNSGFFAQHLVSTGNPFLSLKVMLQAQFVAGNYFSEQEVQSSQNWFRPNNRYAYRVFASMYKKLGTEKAALHKFQYLHLPLEHINAECSDQFRVEEVNGIDPDFSSFIKKNYGVVFLKAEELDKKDTGLKEIGQLYQNYGLKLGRRVLKIIDNQSQKILAATIANRAPIGLNFSYLENRAYYIIDPSLKEEACYAVLQLANDATRCHYKDFPLQIIPIVTNERTAEQLIALGARHVREYMQSIWLRSGFDQWYEHIESFLKRIERKAG